MDGDSRRWLALGIFVMAIALTAYGGFILIAGGTGGNIGDEQFLATDPVPVLSVAAVLLLLYLLLASGALPSLGVFESAFRRRGHWFAVGLSLITVAIGIKFCAPVAGGSDAYGYVSQADRWLDGTLKTHEAWLATVPWPSATLTFSPLGYVPARSPAEPWTIVPMYSPGLPLLMAGVKLAFGHCALFAIVPVSGGLLVLMTYLIGRRLGLPGTGLIGAWLVATSPTLLYMLAWPMSDVPVAAAFATAFFLLLGPGFRNAAFAGLVVSVGILIRPNLFFAAPVFGSYFLLEAFFIGGKAVRERLLQAMIFGLGVLPGFLIPAILNQYLNGSAFTSGYGTMGEVFRLSNFVPNLANYSKWVFDTQTPIVLAGIGALVVPRRELWPGLTARAAPLVMAAFLLCLCGMYFVYIVFDVWWFTRFLLPAWPFLMIATGSVIAAALPVVGSVGRFLIVLAILTLGVNGYGEAAHRGAFDLWKEGKKYVAAAQLVARTTPPESAILSMQHSGSIRYYAGRLTLRYDWLDPAWLDRAVQWFGERGMRTYFLGDEWEVTAFKQQFAGQEVSARLAAPPIFEYSGSNRILLFELSDTRPPDATVEAVTETFDGFPCVPPVPLTNHLRGASKREATTMRE